MIFSSKPEVPDPNRKGRTSWGTVMHIAYAAVVCLLVVPLASSQIQITPTNVEFLKDGTRHHWYYQAGYVFGLEGRVGDSDSLWVDHLGAGPKFAKQLELPGDPRVSILDIAISFDQHVAVSLWAEQQTGSRDAMIVFLDMDGEIIRIVRVSPFAADEIGFTANGILWAIGKEIKNDTEEPARDVLRQYNPEGELGRTLLLPSGPSTHKRSRVGPWNAQTVLLTSRNYVAVVSDVTQSWTLVSSEGQVLDSGFYDNPDHLSLVHGAITDSGRLFVNGLWPTHHLRPTWIGEIEREKGILVRIDYSEFHSDGALIDGGLIGSDGEELVFHLIEYSPRRAGWAWVSSKLVRFSLD